MAKKLKLDQLDVYSTDVERVANSIRRVIEYSDNEEKLFGCFDSYRRYAVSKDKAIWDRCFGHFLNRESGRLHIGQDLVMTLSEKVNNDIDELRRLPSVKNKTAHEGISKKKARLELEKEIVALKKASRVEEFRAYAQALKAGHDEAETLKHLLGVLWKHQEKYQAVLDDTTGNVQLTHQDMRDKQIDMRRYLDSRVRWRTAVAEQAVLKAKLDGNEEE